MSPPPPAVSPAVSPPSHLAMSCAGDDLFRIGEKLEVAVPNGDAKIEPVVPHLGGGGVGMSGDIWGHGGAQGGTHTHVFGAEHGLLRALQVPNFESVLLAAGAKPVWPRRVLAHPAEPCARLQLQLCLGEGITKKNGGGHPNSVTPPHTPPKTHPLTFSVSFSGQTLISPDSTHVMMVLGGDTNTLLGGGGF